MKVKQRGAVYSLFRQPLHVQKFVSFMCFCGKCHLADYIPKYLLLIIIAKRCDGSQQAKHQYADLKSVTGGDGRAVFISGSAAVNECSRDQAGGGADQRADD